MPQPVYLVAIIGSLAGMFVVDYRLALGVIGRRLLITIAVVEVAFLGFDVVATARGWYASDPGAVVALLGPGIPPEEVLLLAFLATFAVVVLRAAERAVPAGSRLRGATPLDTTTSRDA